MIDWNSIKTACGRIQHSLELGTKKINENEIQINIWCPKATSCTLCLYGKGERKRYEMYAITKGIFSLSLQGDEVASFLQGLEYDFVADGKTFPDPYAREIAGRDRFGKKQGKIRGRLDFTDFDWQGENWKTLPTDEIVMYQCHVRGFTKHASSGVKHPGTFAGMQEKISYLKELGVNTLLCLPIYDFDERMKDRNETEQRINYWGYGGEAYYFAPKRGYASGEQATTKEFQQLVKELHRQGMNIYLDMYFEEQSPVFIVQCLRYYALRFHIDGFRINQECMDTTWLSDDPVLSQVRLLGIAWSDCDAPAGDERLMEMNDRFLVDARRFLKSDEGQAENFYHRFREQRNGVGVVHYITQHNGFTLRDLISYDVKHNEANGEKNLDGTEYNYSWNCGAEGPSRKKEVLHRRARQEKNALVMLILGMAVPMLLAGDEFGNSQKGNNNAYCQDNVTTWLDWRLLEKNNETYSFVKQLLTFRREHPLYHRKGMLTGLDVKGLGMPDVSCHGKEPWEVRFAYYSREVGILFYGGYFGGRSLYFAFNFHWDVHDFFLPNVDIGEKWKVLFDTAGQDANEIVHKKYMMQPRSIAVFESVTDRKKKKKKKKKKKGC